MSLVLLETFDLLLFVALHIIYKIICKKNKSGACFYKSSASYSRYQIKIWRVLSQSLQNIIQVFILYKLMRFFTLRIALPPHLYFHVLFCNLHLNLIKFVVQNKITITVKESENQKDCFNWSTHSNFIY